jgi:hypothetical protein
MPVTQIGRGTSIKVALLNSGDRIFPESTVFTVGVGGADAGDTSVSIAMSPAITRDIKGPIYLLFVDANGQEELVEVTADIAVGATTLTCAALKRAIAVGATAVYPVSLSARESASRTTDDQQQDVLTFDNDGYKDSITTILGETLQCNGFYSPLDAGWNTVNYSRINFLEIYLEIEYPKPAPHFVTGQIVKGFAGVNGMPIEIGSTTDIIKSNLEFKFRGPTTVVPPA